jgi:hypothetical protein
MPSARTVRDNARINVSDVERIASAVNTANSRHGCADHQPGENRLRAHRHHLGIIIWALNAKIAIS